MYAELHCHSTFSLLDGASDPEPLVDRAAELGLAALALTDHDDLGGAVRFAQAARTANINGILGLDLTVADPDSPPDAIVPGLRQLVLLAQDRTGYGNLASLVTRARMDHPRGHPRVPLDLVAHHAQGLFALTACPDGLVPHALARGDRHTATRRLAQLHEWFEGRVAVEVWDHGLPDERALADALIALAAQARLPWVVTNDVHYARPDGRIAHDVLAALRHGRTLDEMGTRLRPNGEWHLKGLEQLRRRWRGREEGLHTTLAIAEQCPFRLSMLKPRLPRFPLPNGVGEDEYLAQLVEQGAQERWGWRRTARHDAQLQHELGLVRQLGFAGFFLIVWDLVRFARRQGILCQGRGSAANSAVCYALGITAVDPITLDLLFERFLSAEREEPPDIDVDFAHRDREQVLQYVYERYGREHAAMVCEHITWRGRSAVRDAARVLGFSPQQGDALAAFADRFSARRTAAMLRGESPAVSVMQPAYGDALGPAGYDKKAVGELGAAAPAATAAPAAPAAPTILRRANLDPRDPRVQKLADVVEQLHGAPRHRGIHVGGFVLTEEPLRTVVPIEPAAMADRTVIQWEKDDLDAPGLVKFDCLGLGMLTLLGDCLKYIRHARGVHLDLGQLDMTDQAVYDDLCRADTVGVFQVESRAQMNTLPRLKPCCFYDLVVEVALIRPGPIQGEMVHPYLRRRAGEEPVTYPHPSLEPILRRTLGVPLFQEQGMQVAIAAAGFSPGEADLLRKAMGHKRSRERMAAICRKMIDGMRANGIAEETALRIYHQINAFADYGFPESHAASFALLVYASAYLRHYYPAEYLCAILNAQPMGFYSEGTLVEDARRHGVHVRGPDIVRSGWDHALECPDGLVIQPADGAIATYRLPPRPGATPPAGGTGDPAAGAHRPAPASPVVRLGLRAITGIGGQARARIEQARATGGPFTSIHDVVVRTGLDQRALRCVAESGALDRFVADEPPARRRRVALWKVLEAVRGHGGPLALFPETQVPAVLPALSPPELTEADYRITGISLNGHPMRHVRPLLAPNGVLCCREVRSGRDGEAVAVAGLVICRQRPGTAKGFVFLTLEDETGTINVVITPQRFEAQALLISRTPLLLVRGTLQVESDVVNIRAREFIGLGDGVGAAHSQSHDFR